MNCPQHGTRTEVIDSRASGTSLRRRRVCPEGHRFTTYETLPPEKEMYDRIALYGSKVLDAVRDLKQALDEL